MAMIQKSSGFLPGLCKAFRVCCRLQSIPKQCSLVAKDSFSTVSSAICPVISRPILQSCSPMVNPQRTKMHWDWQTISCNKTEGKPESNKDVLKRFKRLNTGLWIRTRAGRGKSLWRKHSKQKLRLKQHVVCNTQQSNLLDKMVTDEWKKQTYFVDDPYEPYQKRTKMERFGLDLKKPKFIP